MQCFPIRRTLLFPLPSGLSRKGVLVKCTASDCVVKNIGSVRYLDRARCLQMTFGRVPIMMRRSRLQLKTICVTSNSTPITHGDAARCNSRHLPNIAPITQFNADHARRRSTLQPKTPPGYSAPPMVSSNTFRTRAATRITQIIFEK